MNCDSTIDRGSNIPNEGCLLIYNWETNFDGKGYDSGILQSLLSNNYIASTLLSSDTAPGKFRMEI